jgi:hypothetical protein
MTSEAKVVAAIRLNRKILGVRLMDKFSQRTKVIDMTYTSQDEAGTEAIKTAEPDAALRRRAV